MATNVIDDREHSRFVLDLDGETAGLIEYRRDAPGEIVLIHTIVAKEHQGEGLGGVLVRGALDQLRAEGVSVVPKCSYAAGWIAKHPDYQDLVKA